MVATYRQLADQKLNETYSSMSYAKVLAVVLVAATSHAAATSNVGQVSIRPQAQPDTHQTIVVHRGIGALELFGAINSVYDQLLASRTDLEPEMKDILYGNLWDLYE